MYRRKLRSRDMITPAGSRRCFWSPTFGETQLNDLRTLRRLLLAERGLPAEPEPEVTDADFI